MAKKAEKTFYGGKRDKEGNGQYYRGMRVVLHDPSRTPFPDIFVGITPLDAGECMYQTSVIKELIAFLQQCIGEEDNVSSEDLEYSKLISQYK